MKTWVELGLGLILLANGALVWNELLAPHKTNLLAIVLTAFALGATSMVDWRDR